MVVHHVSSVDSNVSEVLKEVLPILHFTALVKDRLRPLRIRKHHFRLLHTSHKLLKVTGLV